MARIAEAAKHYIGPSSEAKPVSSETERVPVGSTYRETDTGALAQYDGEAWRAYDPQAALLDLQAAMHNELVRIRTAVEVLAEIDADDDVQV